MKFHVTGEYFRVSEVLCRVNLGAVLSVSSGGSERRWAPEEKSVKDLI